MDVLRFIKSRTMREHLEKIGYEFSSIECAKLAYLSREIPIEERHKVWQEIIDTMPDYYEDEYFNEDMGLHEVLRRHMEYENMLLQRFLEPDENDVYQFWSVCDDGYAGHEGGFYRTADECFSAAMSCECEDDHGLPVIISITLTRISDKSFQICAEYTPDHRICWISSYTSSGEEIELYDCCFQFTRVAFPTPFKKGDLLYDVRYIYPERGLMVFERIDPYKNFLHNAVGYKIYLDWISMTESSSLHLEYYDGDRFAGVDRTLLYVSKYFRGEISLSDLMNRYHQYLCEYQATAASECVISTEEFIDINDDEELPF